MSDTNLNCRERILWIHGSLGVGKSFMAGYFIDLLRGLSPNSLMAYFFCKRGEKGLTKAQEIIKTLAYQCSQGDGKVFSNLEALETSRFAKDDALGVSFLAQKLLYEPLLQTKKDVHIIIDGLDEADLTARDRRDTVLTEIDVLVKCLGTLPSTRLLFISRPNSNISRLLPNSITRSLTRTDNQRDIRSYVQQRLDNSKRVPKYFQALGVDPIRYFSEHAGGIFLWVVIVLEQLEKVNILSKFRKYLNDFKDASGHMEGLYSQVLSKFSQDDRKLVKEILRWVIVSDGDIGVRELQEVIEWSLEDKVPEFPDFLELECGSILRMNESLDFATPDNRAVALIHESLKSFLTDPENSQQEFYVDEEAAHRHAVAICMDTLSGVVSLPQFIGYGARQMVAHLEKVCTSGVASGDLLSSICRFFESDGCKLWIKNRGCNYFDFFEDHWVTTRAADRLLEAICLYLEQWNEGMHSHSNIGQEWQEGLDKAASTWGFEMLRWPQKLGGYLGKASAELWLYEDLGLRPGACDFPTPFWLSLKYYCKAQNLRIVYMEDLRPLAVGNFGAIQTWVGKKSPVFLRYQALGRAFWDLGLWNEARIAYRHSIDKAEGHSDEAWFGLLYACARLKDHDGALAAAKVCPIKRPALAHWFTQISRSRGDTDMAISALESEIDVVHWHHHLPHLYLNLGETYSVKGDYVKAIMTYERLLEHEPEIWWAWQCLANAYLDKEGIEGMVRVFQWAMERNPKKQWAQSRLLDAETLQMEAKSPYRMGTLLDYFFSQYIDHFMSVELSSAGNVHALQNKEFVPGQVTTCSAVQVVEIQETKALPRMPGQFVIQTRNPGFQFNISLLQQVDHTEDLQCMEFSNDANYIAVAFRRIVQIFSTTTGEKLFTLVDEDDFTPTKSGYRRAIKYIRWRSDGMSILTATDNGVIQIWDIRERQMKNHLELDKAVGALGVSSDGKLLAIASGERHVKMKNHLELLEDIENPCIQIEIYDSERGKIVRRFQTSGKMVPDSIAITDEQLIFGASDGTIATWSLGLSTCTEDGNTIDVGDMHIIRRPFMQSFSKKAWSPDYEMLLTSSWGGCIELWNVKDETPQFLLCYQDFAAEAWRNDSCVSVTNLSGPYHPRGK